MADHKFKRELTFGEALSKVSELAELARAFVHEPENWEGFERSKNSNSVAWPPEWLLLCEAVEDLFGPPVFEDDEGEDPLKTALDMSDPGEEAWTGKRAIPEEEICLRCEHGLSAAAGLCIKKMYGHACPICNGRECRA